MAAWRDSSSKGLQGAGSFMAVLRSCAHPALTPPLQLPSNGTRKQAQALTLLQRSLYAWSWAQP